MATKSTRKAGKKGGAKSHGKAAAKSAAKSTKTGSSKSSKAATAKSAKRAASKKSARAATRGFAATSTRHPGRALAGRGPRGQSLDAGALALMLGPDGGPDPGLAFDRPRPSPTRYPIPLDEYLTLKERVEETKVTPVTPQSNVVTDKGKKDAVLTLGALGAVEVAGAPLAGPPDAAPVTLTSFNGIPATGWLPPDCTMAVGPAHVLLSVNATVAVYSKAGGAPLKQVTLTNWFSNVIGGAKIFDPKALYDQHAGRWVLLAVALGPGAQDSFFLLSVSKTGDPLGAWWNYKLDAKKDGSTNTTNWADYPGLGVDSKALYVTANMFAFGGGFRYAKVRVVPKAAPYAGAAPAFFDFVKLKNADNSLAFTVQPCHTYGAPDSEYMVNSVYPTTAGGTKNKLTLWKLKSPTTAPTLTRLTITTDPYSLPPDAAQKGGGVPLDSGDVRVLNAVARGGSVWCALTTAHDWGAGNRAACHWFQLNATSGALTQQGVYGASAFHYFYPAVAPDSNGNMTMVFSRCGPGEFASARYTGRKASDPAGQLQGSAQLSAGVANYTGMDGAGRNRWGDYAGVAGDPADGLKTWFYTMSAGAGNQWTTRVGASKF